MSTITEVIDKQKYAGLLAHTLPHVIHAEADNERWIAELEVLDGRDDLSAEEMRLAELLTLLIEDYEGRLTLYPRRRPSRSSGI